MKILQLRLGEDGWGEDGTYGGVLGWSVRRADPAHYLGPTHMITHPDKYDKSDYLINTFHRPCQVTSLPISSMFSFHGETALEKKCNYFLSGGVERENEGGWGIDSGEFDLSCLLNRSRLQNKTTT